MSVAYAYENSWDIGTRARGGHMMAGSQSHSCGSDSPTFRSKQQQQDTMIRGLSASISLYIDSSKLSPRAAAAAGQSERVTHSMHFASSPPPKDSIEFLESQDVLRTGPENADAQLSSQGSGSTSSLEAFDAVYVDTVDQGLLGPSHGSFVNSLPSGTFKDSDTEGDEQPLDLTALLPDHSRPASPASSVTSSIGEPRDESCSSSEDEAAAEGMEAQSKYRGPLDHLSELESSLPIK
eukprot:TRINITY_DN459_c0_g1_i3.p1 TRINITY_DN459_c0_g1~~TRINITY_DN459_c0_g1_i3.p1  ORF type:complete len:237 (-),score=39.84 TRINITY_DN459_c0_g1_i3:46-756(-)